MHLSARFVPESKALIQTLGKQLEKGVFGHFSPSIYDTAWLARIRRESTWLFPECFAYLIDTQHPEGGWTIHLSAVDRILNTLAALVALKEHRAQADQDGDADVSGLVGERIVKAQRVLEHWLGTWDVTSAIHVGTEIVVPSLLEALERDGTTIEFPGRKQLMAWNARKLAKFRPEMLYGSHKTTLVHSLEALVGKIEYNRVAHHLDVRGSMMASPAATAAYLMHCSTWDTSAEHYLRKVVREGTGKGNGGVPGAFPSSTFEITWIMSTLLKAHTSIDIIGLPEVVQIRDFVQSQYDEHGGLVGFDSGLLEDSDDTAKLILSSTLMGNPLSLEPLIQEFEAADSFRTYRYEQNGSFSANCNVLDAILHSSDPTAYTSQVTKISQFLCREYDLGTITDKWNLCESYSLMLLAQTLVKLLQHWDQGRLSQLPQELVAEQLPRALLHVAQRTVQAQRDDGSWVYTGADEDVDDKVVVASHEPTAYGVLTLKALSSLPWLTPALRERVGAAVGRGCAYLTDRRDRWADPEHIWVAKASYALEPVSRAYTLAALIAESSYAWNKGRVASLTKTGAEEGRVGKTARFFGGLPLFRDDDTWVLESDVALAQLYRPRLARAVTSIFPGHAESDGGDKYLDYIPFTWVATNRRKGSPLSNSVLYDMMLISLYTYQLDEFMEKCFDRRASQQDRVNGRKLINKLCRFENHQKTNGDAANNGDGHINGNPGGHSQNEAQVALGRFTSYVLGHPAVIQSPDHVRRRLHGLMASCLIAHIDHEEDNQLFAEQQVQQQQPVNGSSRQLSDAATVSFTSARHPSYYGWVHETSAKNTQSPWIFVFFCCLASASSSSSSAGSESGSSGKGKGGGCPPFFVGPRQTYLAEAVSRPLAAFCRQYNDFGSVVRDRAEGNLNSLDFAEFASSTRPTGQVKDGNGNVMAVAESSLTLDARKADLVFIAEYERDCLDLAMGKLAQEMRQGRNGDWKVRALEVFTSTVDLYNSIYAVRDISNRVK